MSETSTHPDNCPTCDSTDVQLAPATIPQGYSPLIADVFVCTTCSHQWMTVRPDDTPPEDLLPELAQHVYTDPMFGDILHHPLVIMLHMNPLLHAAANSQYRQKTAGLHDALANGNYDRYVNLHERPYRLEALQHLISLNVMTPEQHWSLVATTWTDSENIREFPDEWADILTSDVPEPHHIMTADDFAALSAMPDTITIYQGHTTARDDGWSWTLDLDTACWFAGRFTILADSETHSDDAFPDFPAGTPLVSTAHVQRDDVLAYFTTRGEDEILINPAYIHNRTTQPVTGF